MAGWFSWIRRLSSRFQFWSAPRTPMPIRNANRGPVFSFTRGVTWSGGFAFFAWKPAIGPHRMPASIWPDIRSAIMASADEFEAGIDHQLIGSGIRHQAVDRHVRARRRAGHDADTLAFQALVFQRRHVFEAAALLGDQRIGGAVIGIGALNQVVALREAHDDVATMGAKRHPDEAGRLREVHVVQLLVQLLGEQFGELVLESLALVVGERQIVRIGADAQHLGIDELDRQIAGFLDLRARDIAPDEYGEDRQYRDRQPALLPGICHQKLLHFRPTMVANSEEVSATPTNEVPLKPQTSKMLSLSIGALQQE